MPDYSVYGLKIASDITLPPLAAAGDGPAPADVTIRHGKIGDPPAGGVAFRTWHALPARFHIVIGPGCRMDVTGGKTITIEGADAVPPERLVSMILGSGMAALLMQRGIVPLHACSIAIDGGALVVMGRSGAGWICLLATLLQQGYPMVSDDVLGLRLAETCRVMALPAFPAVRLWQDSLAMLGHSADGLARVQPGMAKHYLPIAATVAGPLPVRAIVQLTNTNAAEPELREVPPSNRTECLSRYIFRKRFMAGMQLRALGFSVATRLATSVPFLRLARPATGSTPRAVADLLLDRLAALKAEA